MIKGVSKRVIMVESPDPKLFENAIFILKNEVFSSENKPEVILKQAQKIANEYMQANIVRKKKRIPPMLYAAAGAIAGSSAIAVLCLLR